MEKNIHREQLKKMLENLKKMRENRKKLQEQQKKKKENLLQRAKKVVKKIINKTNFSPKKDFVDKKFLKENNNQNFNKFKNQNMINNANQALKGSQRPKHQEALDKLKEYQKDTKQPVLSDKFKENMKKPLDVEKVLKKQKESEQTHSMTQDLKIKQKW